MSKKNVNLMEFEGNPNVGIYMFVNDKFCLIGPQISEDKKKEIENTFQVPVYKTTILETDLIGIFLVGNNDFIISPQMHSYEREQLEKICHKHDVKLLIVEDIQNTYGNNICVGNKKIIINPHYSKDFVNSLKEQTGLEIISIDNEHFKAIGSTCKYLNNKYFISQEFEEKEVIDFLDEIGGVGTVNKGSNYISSGLVGNSNGLILGSMSSTVEIQNIVESLDYI